MTTLSAGAAYKVFALICLLLALVFGVLWSFDPRQFEGVNTWIKPFKFAISIALQSWTLWVLMGLITPSNRNTPILIGTQWTFLISASFELGYIALQSAQAKASHFNLESPMSILLYGLMGVGAVLMMLCLIPIGLAIWKHKSSDIAPIVQSGALWGIAISLPMTLIVAGYMSSSMSHFVGPHDQALPLLGWSLFGGDLRVSHFFALHSLQACMLAGWLSQLWLKPMRAIPLIITIILSVFLTVYSFVQALNALPFTRLIS
jgi:ABC-type amino acid transport system permease subunit